MVVSAIAVVVVSRIVVAVHSLLSLLSPFSVAVAVAFAIAVAVALAVVFECISNILMLKY